MNCPSCGAPTSAGLEFCQACGRPLTGESSSTPAAPVSQSTTEPQSTAAGTPPSISQTSVPEIISPGSYSPTPPAKSGGALPWILGGCGCLALLGVLVILAAGGYWISKNPEFLSGEGQTIETAPITDPSSSSQSATPAAADVTRIDLTWNEQVDMDLEIWNEAGETLLKRSFNLCGEDIKDGTRGPEWFEFKRYSDDDDYSSGTYMVSLFFAARPEGSTVEQASATITITKPDGTTVTRQKTINWEPGRDQWHAFTINAATGAITVKDQFIQVQQQNNE